MVRLTQISAALTGRHGRCPRAWCYGLVSDRDWGRDRDWDWDPKRALLGPAQLEQALSPRPQGTDIASPRTDNL